jgi:hypothetical protein
MMGRFFEEEGTEILRKGGIPIPCPNFCSQEKRNAHKLYTIMMKMKGSGNTISIHDK